jgi:pimeloyl-ACP methyl ester carboxylesterase
MKSLYKSLEAKNKFLALYDEKLKSLGIDYKLIDINTKYGRTRVIKSGNENGKVVVLFHGINAGAPLALGAVKELREKYLFYAIDTIGQATKSDETQIDIRDNSYSLWCDEVLGKLSIEKATFIGISYGAYILQKLITHHPERVSKCIFVVPSGFVNGDFINSMTKLTIPLMRFLITKKDNHLKSFIKSFVPEDDDFMFRFQKLLLLGVNMDYRRPVLLQKKDVEHFTAPVYMMVSDNDIFFPGDGAVNRAKQIFTNLKDVHYLKNTKHIPHFRTFPEIQNKLSEWINQ